MAIRPDVRRRLRVAENRSGVGVRQGLAMVEMLRLAASRDDADVIALEVNGPRGERLRISRLPGESIDALEGRANPRGTWHARPEPIFRG